MPTSKKPRKRYRPRKLIPGYLPMTFSLPKAAMTNLQLPPHTVLDAFRRGAGDEPGWHTLACAVNIGAVLARTQPNEAQAVMSAALDAIREVQRRGVESGRWGVSGDEFRAIGEALTLSNEIQDISTRREIRDAINVVLETGAV